MKSLLPAIGLAFTALAVAPVTSIAAQEAQVSAISPAQQSALKDAATLGEAIYRHDQAAWHTTDTLMEAFDSPASLGIIGWIVNEVRGGHEVVFYRSLGANADAGFEAVYSALYDGAKVRDERIYERGDRALTDAEAAMAVARSLPFSADTDYSLCSERVNSVVLPSGKGDGGLYVYMLSPQPALDQVPFGGHFRFEVVNGAVVDHRRFTNTCLTMPLTSKDGEVPEAIGVAHILDETPTEIHVFSTYVAGLPIYVSTTKNEKLWRIELVDGLPRIGLVSQN